jgi:methylenetetrahydrofolate--tRNA-(uracil-5-)-methyltransferase
MAQTTASLTQKLKDSAADVIVVGGGLAGSECAWQLLRRGHRVLLIEQRPVRTTEAHTGELLAELVCSNSLKSSDPESAPGLLKAELAKLDSLVLRAAMNARVPAGQALAVDRDKFSAEITRTLEKHPRLEIVRQPVTHFEELLVTGPFSGHGASRSSGLKPVVVATGPLTSPDFADSLQKLIGDRLYFYDAIAPIVSGPSVDRSIAFVQNRYNKGEDGEPLPEGAEGDYLNCPFTEQEYENFIDALGAGDKVASHDFEKLVYFQGCQPVEALLEKGRKTLAFGPMKPVGLVDPRTGKQPFAVIQLRKEDNEGRAWNMVGFQTKLKYPEQQRIFRMIPGLANAEFYRFGSLHRNTYLNSPALLDSALRLKDFPAIHFAGQVTGVEGYLESTAIGALVGRLISLRLGGFEGALPPPQTTALGALAYAIYNGRVKDFQPMNINWGLVPLNEINERDKQKKEKMVARAERQFKHWMAMFGE